MTTTAMTSLMAPSWFEDGSSVLNSRGRDGLLIACLAPAVVYVILHGQTVHFIYLFVCFLVLRVLLGIVEVSKVAYTVPSPVAGKGRTVSQPLTRSISALGPMRGGPRQHRVASSKSMARVSPTNIISSDEPRKKARRAILNKISPDKLDDLTEKLVATFDTGSSGERLNEEISECVSLVFAAASRQPQYIHVFADLLGRILKKVETADSAEDILTRQAQTSWATTCLCPVEKTKDWGEMSEDDQLDARTRHRAKQLAIAEFCGLLSTYELLPPFFPLSWLETLLSSTVQGAIKSGHILKDSSTESSVEIILCSLKGLGASEATGLFTDLDQTRFDMLCNRLFALPIESSRVKCLLQDLLELRESGWSKVPNWKRALIPTKRGST